MFQFFLYVYFFALKHHASDNLMDMCNLYLLFIYYLLLFI